MSRGLKRQFSVTDGPVIISNKRSRAASKIQKFARRRMAVKGRSMLAKQVRDIILRESETKYWVDSILYQTIVTTTGASPQTANELSPKTMVQGVDNGERIGESIRVKRCIAKIAAIQNGGAVVIGPTYLSVYLARPRLSPNVTPTNTQYTQLKHGDTPGTYTNEDSTTPDTFYAPINTDVWDVAWHDTCLIGLSNPSVASGLSTNNNSVIYREWEVDLTSKLPKKISFQGTNNVDKSTWFLFAFAYEINSSPTTNAVYPLIRGSYNLEYCDP